MKTISHIIRVILFVISSIKKPILRMLYPQLLEYAPNGWKTVLTQDETEGCNATSVVTAEKGKWDAFCDAIKGTEPLGFSHDHTDIVDGRNVRFHNIHITYGCVGISLAQEIVNLDIRLGRWAGPLLSNR